MNIAVSKSFIEYAEKEIAKEIMYFSTKTLSNEKAKQLAEEIVSKIDWNNSALMHKGFSWIAKNFLIQKNLIKI